MKTKYQRGVALVATLIMLSLVTFTAVVFLAVTTRERDSVKIQDNATSAKNAADQALYRAEAEIMAYMLRNSNRLGYDLLVSTNIDGAYGTYDLTTITNLWQDGRAPVYIPTNSAGVLDFRFYVDLNRNHQFESNVTLVVGGVTNVLRGDPEWIMITERPSVLGYETNRHSATNRIVGRYAYLVLPAGKSLDANLIHNYSKRSAGFGDDIMTPALQDGYNRNQGVGPWEINLAAFLRQLNTNFWYDYAYTNGVTLANSGVSFNDAQALLRYRYNSNVTTLSSLTDIYGTAGLAKLTNDNVDFGADGPFPAGTALLTNDNDSATASWPGSINTNRNSVRYYDAFDLVNRGAAFPGFTNRLLSTLAEVKGETPVDLYNRYTMYRMLSQFGAESTTLVTPKIHLNYDNQSANITNLSPWVPTNFFHLAADQMMKATLGYGYTNLQLYPTNQYTTEVHRYLQLAANILDASTNRTGAYPDMPSVFRPVFTNTGTQVLLKGYVEETNSAFLGNTYLSLTQLAAQPAGDYATVNVHGMPVIIGAKKGLPNLNELSLQTVVKVSRRLEFRKAATNQPPNQTNQMFVVGISNVLGVEAWNSYTSAYPRPLTMRVTNLLTMAITNAAGTVIWPTAGFPIGTNASAFGSIAAATWLGAPSSQAFKVPMNGTFNFMPDSQYYFAADTFVPTTNTLVSHAFETGQGFYLPKWTLAVSNRLTYALVDTTYDRVVDFVTLDNMNFGTDISSVLSSLGAQGSLPNMWDTNRVGGSASITVMPIGVQNQILSSEGFPVPSDTDWANFNTTTPTKNDAINRFRVYMGLTQLAGAPTLTAAQQAQVRSSNVWVAPFTPSAVIYNRTSWAANDPLVHYTVSDLTDNFYGNSTNQSLSLGQVKLTGIPQSNLGKLNFDPSSGVYRYNPWGGPRNPGGAPLAPGDTSGTYFNVALKDAGVRWPDDWQFPSNRFASVGQLGRVHRGTPWQTIYLKAGVADKALWQKWNTSDATHPTNDWTIIDLFTAAPDDNSQRGLLSINQANEAAWAAVLGGVRVLYNTNDYNAAPGIASQSGLTPMTIDPATPQLKDLVDSINLYRESLTNQIPSQTFTNLGQILGVPRLTIGLNGSGANEFSPYLTNSLLSPYDASDKNLQEGVNDVVLERIPEQVLSLLTVERYPRIVVYAFGQALKPAERSLILTPGPSRGVCTNYQITGEVITRTVLRFEGAPTNSMRAVVESYNVLSSY